MLKPIVNDNIRNKMNLGCHLDGWDRGIGEIFMYPNAQENFLRRVEYYLSRRYHNKKSFSLRRGATTPLLLTAVQQPVAS